MLSRWDIYMDKSWLEVKIKSRGFLEIESMSVTIDIRSGYNVNTHSDVGIYDCFLIH